jgi:hypothetical protein
MAVLSYMQRRTSGTYEFRRRLLEALAGKPVPAHMRGTFPDLVDTIHPVILLGGDLRRDELNAYARVPGRQLYLNGSPPLSG